MVEFLLWVALAVACCTASFILCPFLASRTRKLSKSRQEEGEVLAYAWTETPTIILAQLVAQRITTYPEGISRYSETWKSKDGTIEYDSGGYSHTFHRLTIHGKRWEDLGKEGNKIVVKAFKAAEKFNEEKQKADREYALQMEALNAIEKLMGLKENRE